MENEKFYELKGYRVRVEFTKYLYNNALAVKLITENDEPYAVVSVNLLESDYIPKMMAFIDINNCKWAEKFLTENGIATPTGEFGESGFCTYPLYDFGKYIKSRRANIKNNGDKNL